MIYVVFVEPETPGNIGFLARTMKNFGLSNLVLINPCDIENDAYYKAMHAKEVITNRKTYDSLQEFIEKEDIDFTVATTGEAGGSYNLPRIAVTPEQFAESLNINGKVAVVFGREGDGLTNKEISLCDVVVSIPTHEDYPIMNISHAAAIVFYEIFKKKVKSCQVEDLEKASNLEKNDLLNCMEEIIGKLGYPPHKSKNAFLVFRRIIGRAFISEREAYNLKGTFRRINQRMNNTQKDRSKKTS